MSGISDSALIVLAAGKGTRMKSDLPKVLHPLGGRPLLAHALKAGEGAARAVVVAGHGAELVRAAVAETMPDAEVVVQREQLGTGHAVAQAGPALKDFAGDAIVLYGDTPFIRPETLMAMQAARASGAAVVVLGFMAETPGRYGRLILSPSGDLEGIIEAKEASPDQLAIRLCNSGVVCAKASLLFDLVAGIGNDNAAGEYYLTDIVALARGRGLRTAVVTCDEEETLGINSRAELAQAESAFQARARLAAMEGGATLIAPETVFLSADTEIGRDVVIHPNVVIGPGVRIGDGAEIRAFSHLEGCTIAPGAQIGPYARLRPGAEIAKGARIGNFVEVKNARIGEGAKVNHLSYVGDAHVGASANIGAGTITCNYDGVMKHQTKIGEGAFIGSNTALVAPVEIGAAAITGSGSVITRDVPDGALATERAPQVTRDGLAVKYMARLRAIKAGKTAKTSKKS